MPSLTSSFVASNNERHYLPTPPPTPLPNIFIIHRRTSSLFANNNERHYPKYKKMTRDEPQVSVSPKKKHSVSHSSVQLRLQLSRPTPPPPRVRLTKNARRPKEPPATICSKLRQSVTNGSRCAHKTWCQTKEPMDQLLAAYCKYSVSVPLFGKLSTWCKISD